MLYPIVIEEGDADTAYGVIVPDLPGCFSAGDSLDEAVERAKEAAAAWIDTALDKGMEIPKASSLHDIRTNPDYANWTFGLIDLEETLLDDTIDAYGEGAEVDEIRCVARGLRPAGEVQFRQDIAEVVLHRKLG